MINFIIYKATGEIVRTGSCQDCDLEYQPSSKEEKVIEGQADIDSHYIKDGKVRQYSEFEFSQRFKALTTPGLKWSMPERRVVDARDIETVRAQVWNDIKAARSREQYKPFQAGGLTYDSHPAISNAANAALLAKMSGQEDYVVNWTMADNTVRPHTADGMIGLGLIYNNLMQSIHDHSINLRVKIDVATTLEELDKITWETYD
jgi:hypothetical protein